MARSVRFLGAVLLLSLFCNSSMAASFDILTEEPPDLVADALEFGVLQVYWPGTFCKDVVKKCCAPTTGLFAEEDFLIGDLVFYNSSGKLCNKGPNCTTFDFQSFIDVVPTMNYYWPDLKCPSNNGVTQWNQQWCAFGNCSFSNQRDYFKNAVTTYVKHKPYKYLTDAGIVPTSNRTYTFQRIQTALTRQLGTGFNIECLKNRPDTLYKINICVTTDGLFVVSCRYQFLKSNCNKANIKFPPQYKFSENAGVEMV